MSEETYLNIARWSGLIFIVLINVSFFKAVLNLLVGLAAAPFFMVMQAFAF